MSSVTTAIELTDRISPVLYSIVSALNTTIDAFEEVNTSMNNSFDTSKIDSARVALTSANASIQAMGENTKNNTNHQNELNQKIQEGSRELDGMAGSVMGVVSAYAGMKAVQKLVNLSDEYVQTTARLNLMNDGLQTTDELQQKIFASAQRARASYQTTADVVTKLGLQAGKAFKSNDELIAFAEQLNKTFVISGTSATGIESTMYNLTQALSTGVLRGQDLNAVFANSPQIVQNIADYLDVDIGKIRDMAAQGKISADIVKNAMLAAAKQTNETFDQMPMTWSQVWTQISNSLYQATQPVLEVISLLAQNWEILEPIVLGLATAVGIYTAALITYNTVKGISAIAESVHAASMAMSTGATFTATAAQYGFNAALLACPLTWILLIIIAVIAAIYAIVAAINKWKGTSISATGIIFGAFNMLFANIYNQFIVPLQNAFATVVNFLANCFKDPIASIKILFMEMKETVLKVVASIVQGIENLINLIPGVNIDITSGINNTLSSLRNDIQNAKDEMGWEDVIEKWDTKDLAQAFNEGYAKGEEVENAIGNFFGGGDIPGVSDVLDGISGSAADTAGNTGSIKNSLDATEEDLKYLRDLAEQEAINRFTTAEIKVDMTNNNNISNDMDLDGVVDYLANGVDEAMKMAAEGVHE